MISFTPTVRVVFICVLLCVFANWGAKLTLDAIDNHRMLKYLPASLDDVQIFRRQMGGVTGDYFVAVKGKINEDSFLEFVKSLEFEEVDESFNLSILTIVDKDWWNPRMDARKTYINHRHFSSGSKIIIQHDNGCLYYLRTHGL